MGNVWFAMGLTVLAGMATGIGSVIAFATRRSNYRFLSVATGFSAGVMLYVSFVEILPKGTVPLVEVYGDYWGDWVAAGSFFAGILLIGLIDNLIPSAENPHSTHSERERRALRPQPEAQTAGALGTAVAASLPQASPAADDHQHLMRTGLFTALAIAIHNFPEGLATFLAALEEPGLGVAIAVAVALHNVPEGISVSVPIFFASGNRTKAFAYSALSGLAEPVGAGVAYLALRLLVGGPSGVIPPQAMGILFGLVAGIMVYISVDELLPTSRAYGRGHDSLLGLVAGMAVMAISLLIM